MKVQGIVLAAGFSSRMKSLKMKLKIGDKTLLEKSMENLLDFCSEIYVICGFQCDEIKRIVGSNSKVNVIFNKNFENGMFSSIKTGLAQISADRVFILPGDIPFVEKQVYQKLLKNHSDIVIPIFRGQKGHPILLNLSVIKKILLEDTDSNLRKIIRKIGYETMEVDSDSILIDIDTIDDYKKHRGQNV